MAVFLRVYGVIISALLIFGVQETTTTTTTTVAACGRGGDRAKKTVREGQDCYKGLISEGKGMLFFPVNHRRNCYPH